MRRVASGIARLVPRIDAVYTSPLVRAVETSHLLSAAWGAAIRPRMAQVLAPGNQAAEAARWLKDAALQESVALVGHEPLCSELIAWLTGGEGGLHLELGKGGAALVDARDEGGRLRGTLVWLATPRLLRLAGR